MKYLILVSCHPLRQGASLLERVFIIEDCEGNAINMGSVNMKKGKWGFHVMDMLGDHVSHLDNIRSQP